MNPTNQYVTMETPEEQVVATEQTTTSGCSCGGNCGGNCNCSSDCGCDSCKEKIMNKAQSFLEKSKSFLKKNTNDENLIKIGLAVCVVGIVYVYFKD